MQRERHALRPLSGRPHDRALGCRRWSSILKTGRPTADVMGEQELDSVPYTKQMTGLVAIQVVIAVLLVLDGLALLVLPDLSTPIGTAHLPVLGVAILVAGAELASVHLDVGRGRQTISMAEFPFTLGLFLLVPIEQLLAQLVGLALVLLLVRRQPPVKLAFNLVQSWFATAAGVLVFHAIVPAGATATSPVAWLAALVAAAVVAVVSTSIVSHVVALLDGRVGFQDLRGSVVGATSGAIGNASLALLVVALLSTAPTTLALLVLPLGGLFAAYRISERQRQANRSLAFLYRISQTLATGQEVDTSLAELTDTVRTRMNVRDAVVVVAPTGGDDRATGIICRAAEGRDAQVEHRVLTPLESSAVGALYTAGSIHLQPDQSAFGHGFDPGLLAELDLAQDAVLVSLQGADRPLGFVIVAERLGELDTLGDDDAELLVAVADQLATSLTAARLENSLSELHRLQETLRHRADHDALTGLCNRFRFTAEVDDELRRAPRSTAVLFLDLDDFKTINDSMGHHAGDELLRAVARRLEGAIKVSDLVARLGGDEFGVLLRDVTDDRAREVADRLTSVLTDPFELEIGAVSVGTSVGIAQHAGDEPASAATLLRNADTAMYAAKRDGGTRTRAFEQAMHEQASTRLRLRNDLQRAMVADEFLLHLQPLVDLTGGHVLGAESLLRWQHPDRGLLGPGAFLDLAEETGVLRELGHRILRASCDHAVGWPDQTIVSVNLSRSQLLADDRLVTEVADALRDSGLAPHRLLLEVTEFAVTSNVERATAVLRELSDLGVRIALDDFGTGYSSLQHLARLPVHVLKIAKPFVDALSGEAPDQTALIAHGIIEMADALGLDTIAEGIEEEQQADVLRRWGSRIGQGYLLGRPMPPEDLLAMSGWDLPTTVSLGDSSDDPRLDGLRDREEDGGPEERADLHGVGAPATVETS